jgi:2-phospho-L-lactate guanylyltransferase
MDPMQPFEPVNSDPVTTERRPDERRPDERRPGSWRVVLPIKDAPGAKSRLSVGPGLSRAELARAMALDTLAAVVACPLVEQTLVITSDPATADAAEQAGATVAPDPGTGLNGAVRRGAELLGAAEDGPVAVLLADLPALRSPDLAAALTACAGLLSAYVPDAEGTGTVLLAAAGAGLLRPAFGAGSAARHDLVARRLDLDLPGLRRDVDLESSLRAAIALGVGPRTAAVLARADDRWLA